MPQVLADLRKIAPERTEVDDELVGRWNRLTELWRIGADFRRSVLRYATLNAADDPASLELWPEVVYPLIERARWQRRLRTRAEDFWDVVAGKIFQVPPPGLRMDRAFDRDLPRAGGRRARRVADRVRGQPRGPRRPPRREPGRRARLGLDQRDGPGPLGVDPRARRRRRGPQGVRAAGRARPGPPRDGRAPRPLTAPPSPTSGAATTGSSTTRSRSAPTAWRSSPRSAPGPPAPWRSRGCRTSRSSCSSPPSAAAARAAGRSWPPGTTRTGASSSPTPTPAAPSATPSGTPPPAASRTYDDPADLNHDLLQHAMESPDQVDRVLTKRYQPRNTA